MLSRLGPIRLLMCMYLLLALNPAPAQSAPPLSTDADACIEFQPAFPQDVAVMWLYVVKEGRIRKLSFSADALSRLAPITVDGYVNGVVLLSKSPLIISVDRRPMNDIQTNAEGYFKLKYFGYLDRKEFWSTFLAAGQEERPERQIQGRYSSFPQVPGDALSPSRQFQITVEQDGFKFPLTVLQDTPVKLETQFDVTDRSDGPDVYYRGDNPGQFEHSRQEFEQRLNAIRAGVRMIEDAVGGPIVDRVNIIDYDGPHNAYSCEGENQIWFYRQVFWNEAVSELRTIAGHETMHILSDRLGFSDSSRMRELYAELRGFDLFSMERFLVVTTGRVPAAGSIQTTDANDSLLFDFINEINFIRGMNGGHSRDNLDEFCASFLHTLLYIDRFEYLLNQPIRSRSGIPIEITPDERIDLFHQYRKVLSTMQAILPARASSRLNTLIMTCFERLDQVEPESRRAVGFQQQSSPRS